MSDKLERRRPRFARASLLLFVAFAAWAGCAHAIKSVGDCDRAPAEQRVACAACTVKNEAGGIIGGYEYKPDNDPSNRCVRVE
jgi:hypothetical protein